MKLIIKDSFAVADDAALTAIDISSFNGGELRHVHSSEKTYQFQPALQGGIGLNPDSGNGLWEEKNGVIPEILSVEPQTYVLTGNDEDLSNIENWAKYGPELLGKFQLFMDWKCLRSEIKTLALSITAEDIGTNWSNLNAEEQKIACQYMPNLVPSAKFIATYINTADRSAISMNFDSKSTESRTQRYFVMRSYLLGKIGNVNGVKFLDDCIRDMRIDAYLGGIEVKSSDGVDGLFDMIDGTTGTRYIDTASDELKGLRHRGYQIVDGSGDSLDEACNTLLGIANGFY